MNYFLTDTRSLFVRQARRRIKTQVLKGAGAVAALAVIAFFVGFVQGVL